MTDFDAEDVRLGRDDAAGRYEIAHEDTEIGFADFVDHPGNVRELPHTVVHEQFGGRGFAGRLVGYALDDIRAAGMRVLPTCPYVDSYIDKHPEYTDLRVGS